MSYRCFICHRPSRGFGYADPNKSISKYERQRRSKRFCSLLCQQIHYQLLSKGVQMQRDDLNHKARGMTLAPLADYVTQVGMEKGLGAYSKDEIKKLVNTILDSYHNALQKLYKDEVPFDV